jgi:hypothetical protein
MRKQRKTRLGKEILRKLSSGELSMVAGATHCHNGGTCPAGSCPMSCPIGTGFFPVVFKADS